MVGFIIRSLTQTRAMQLTVVDIKKHEPKGHLNVAISIKYGYQLSQISRATAQPGSNCQQPGNSLSYQVTKSSLITSW